MMSFLTASCCAHRERDEDAVEILSAPEVWHAGKAAEDDNDGGASTISFVSASSQERDLPNNSTASSHLPEPASDDTSETEAPAVVASDVPDDVALVLRRVAAGMQDGRLTEWQRQWCTPEVVQVHLDARNGDADKASEILAEALRQRDEFKDVLSFARQPIWQSDLRVLARGPDGHTCVYICMKNQVDHPSARACLEHIALVLDVAVRQLQQQATTFDVVGDCHGLRISRNLDPRVPLGFAGLLKHAFRDRMRLGLVIDGGVVFGSLWRMLAPALPAKTKDKILIASGAKALDKLSEVAGKSVADAVAEQMRANRSAASPAQTLRQPTELEEDYVS